MCFYVSFSYTFESTVSIKTWVLQPSFYSTVYKSQALYIFASLELDGSLVISHSPRGFHRIIGASKGFQGHLLLLLLPPPGYSASGHSDSLEGVWLPSPPGLITGRTGFWDSDLPPPDNMIPWLCHYYDLLCLPKEVLEAFLLYVYLNLRPLEKDKAFQYKSWYLCVPLPPSELTNVIPVEFKTFIT